MRPPERLPSPRQYARMEYRERVQVLAELQSLRLAYLTTEAIEPSTARQPCVYPYTGDRLGVDIQH